MEKENEKEFNLRDEAKIITALNSCLDILGLIADNSFNKESSYLFESLFIRLRHLSYFLTQESSPLISCKEKLSKNELAVMDKIVNIRIASAHPEANHHWLNEYMMISGAMNFKDGDVEIQYGSNKIFLVKEVINVYKKMRIIFSQAPELSHLDKHPRWEYQERELKEIEEKLIELLKNPGDIFKSRLGCRGI